MSHPDIMWRPDITAWRLDVTAWRQDVTAWRQKSQRWGEKGECTIWRLQLCATASSTRLIYLLVFTGNVWLIHVFDQDLLTGMFFYLPRSYWFGIDCKPVWMPSWVLTSTNDLEQYESTHTVLCDYLTNRTPLVGSKSRLQGIWIKHKNKPCIVD